VVVVAVAVAHSIAGEAGGAKAGLGVGEAAPVAVAGAVLVAASSLKAQLDAPGDVEEVQHHVGEVDKAGGARGLLSI
jgi:hypothetical protein